MKPCGTCPPFRVVSLSRQTLASGTMADGRHDTMMYDNVERIALSSVTFPLPGAPPIPLDVLLVVEPTNGMNLRPCADGFFEYSAAVGVTQAYSGDLTSRMLCCDRSLWCGARARIGGPGGWRLRWYRPDKTPYVVAGTPDFRVELKLYLACACSAGH